MRSPETGENPVVDLDPSEPLPGQAALGPATRLLSTRIDRLPLIVVLTLSYHIRS